MANEREKLAKQIVVEVNDVEYTLEYNRDSLKRMESKGFVVGDIDKKIMTSIDLMLEGALWKNHPKLSQAQLETILDTIYREYPIADMTQVLMEMFMQAVPDFSSTKETDGKKVFKIVR